ncbi:MAG: hypothetical protein IJT21_04705 [Synergistaceae bacterium]|nr:hypothetical protein [Synergistaceae bacterium]
MLNLLNKLRRPEAHLKYVSTHYGMKFFLPERVSENAVLKSLKKIPDKSYKLPEGQGIVLDFGGRLCSRLLILHMLNSIVWEKGIKVIAWLSGNPDTLKLFKDAGLSTTEPAINLNAPKPEQDSESNNKKAHSLRIVYNSMRGGQKIETEGDVLLWGHLNPGAEIVAGGSIIVAGKLLGVVHAGGLASERDDIFIWAGHFETPQVRIANKLCYIEPDSAAYWRKNVLITLEDGAPVIRENKFLGGYLS